MPQNFSISIFKTVLGVWHSHTVWAAVCWWWRFDWTSFARVIAPVVTIHHPITLSSNKIQNGDILVPANPGPHGKMAFKQREKNNHNQTVFIHTMINSSRKRHTLLTAERTCRWTTVCILSISTASASVTRRRSTSNSLQYNAVSYQQIETGYQQLQLNTECQ